MKKGLLLVCAVLVGLAFVAYALPAKQMPKNIRESDDIKVDYSVATATKAVLPGVIIGPTGYADAWRGTASMQGKSIISTSDGMSIGFAYGKKGTGNTATIQFAYSNDGGSSWDITPLTFAANQNVRIYNGLALDDYGSPYMVYQDRGVNSIQWVKDEGGFGGGAWTTPDTFAFDSMAWYLPSMDIRGDKLIAGAFAHGGVTPVGTYDVHICISEDLGATWMAPWDREPLPYGWNPLTKNVWYPGEDLDEPDWIFSPSGDTIIAFFDAYLDPESYSASAGFSGYLPCYKMSFDGGVNWEAADTLPVPHQYMGGGWWYRFEGLWADDKPVLMYGYSNFDWNGGAVFVYTPTVAGNYTNWTCQRISDVAVSNQSGLLGNTFNGGYADYPTISKDAAGNLFCVYMDCSRTAQKSEVFGVASTDGGATWLNPVELTDMQGGLDGPMVYFEGSNTVGTDNKIHTLYQDSLYTNIYYASFSTAPLLAASARPNDMAIAPILVSYAEETNAAGSPVGDGTVNVLGDTLYFIWSPIVGFGGEYQLLASQTSDFSANVYQFGSSYLGQNYAWTTLSGYHSDMAILGMPSTGVWYWKVQSRKGAERSPWSTVFDFDYQGTAINNDTTQWIPWTGVTGGDKVASSAFMLNQSFPNPVRDNAAISFSLPKAGAYSLKVYNVAGQVVRTMNGTGTAGMNTVNVNSRNLSNGVYFYQLTANNNTATKKMVVLK